MEVTDWSSSALPFNTAAVVAAAAAADDDDDDAANAYEVL